MNPVEKAEQLRLRKNEVARLMRARRGDELREKQREYVRRNREKVKREAEEYIQQIANIKPKNAEPKKEQPIVKIEKDKGKLISKAERTGIKGVTDKTAKDYIYKISVIHKVFTEDDLDKELLLKIFLGKGTDTDEDKLLDNMKYIKDVDILIETITKKYDNLQSRKGYISPFLTLTSYLKCLNKINYEILRLKFEEVNNEIYGIRKENIKPKNENLIDNFDEENILELSKKLGSDDKLIYQFYTLQPPRRNDDVVKIELLNKGYENKTLDGKKNFIVIDENNKAIELIYNKYKTEKIYGRQKIPFENENLISTIQKHIIRHSLKDGDKLFKYGRTDVFGKAIERVFTKVYTKKITLNTIRHSYITWEMRVIRNVRYLENLSLLMGHSKEEQQLYRRV